jgi:hypothetical protein
MNLSFAKHMLVLTVSFAVPAFAADPFDGTWKGDVSSIRITTSPSLYLLKDGVYSCASCTPPQQVRADGRFHPVTGHSRYDEIAARVISRQSFQLVRRKAGKIVGDETSTVSSDGNRLRFVYRNWREGVAVPSTEAGTKRRVQAAPPGAHAISGGWVTDHISSVSIDEITTTYRVDGPNLVVSDPLGKGYTAPLDGSRTPIGGSMGGMFVSVRRINEKTIEESMISGDRVQEVTTLTLLPDGNTMEVTWENRIRRAQTSYRAYRQ